MNSVFTAALLVLAAIVIVLAVIIGDRIPWRKLGKYRIGLYFGVVCILLDLLRFCVSNANVLVGLRDIPVIAASFFFHPVSGLVAAAICTVERLALLYIGMIDAPWAVVFSTLGVGIYAAAMSQWIFIRKRPSSLPAAVAAFSGVLFHFSFTFAGGVCSGRETWMLEIVADNYPLMPALAAILIGLASLFLRLRSGKQAEKDASLFWSMAVFGLLLLAAITLPLINAYHQTRAVILTASKQLEDNFDDHIGHNLHGLAKLLVQELQSPENHSGSDLQQYADLLHIDEINIISAEGELLASNRPAVAANRVNRREIGVLKDFFKLTGGERKFIDQDFRESCSEQYFYAKYVGIPFPDRSAFLQLGYAYSRLEKEFATFFFPMFNKAKIGEKGFFIVADKSGKISAPVAGHPRTIGKTLRDIGMTESGQNALEKNYFSTTLFNMWGLGYRYGNIGDWTIYAYVPYTEFYVEAIYHIMIFGAILFIVSVAFRLAWLRIAVEQKKNDDLRADDLLLAATIQKSELPDSLHETDSYRIQALMTPAKEVGGDFYDYYELNDGRMAVTIADVSGKGIPAAIFMMKAKNILRQYVMTGVDLTRSIELTNQKLKSNNHAAMFVTAWVGIFDPEAQTLQYVCAGHNPPLIIRAGGRVKWLQSAIRQKPLAAFANVSYRSEIVPFGLGDSLFLYTDGVTEAMNPQGELFGTERLEACFGNHSRNLTGAVSKNLKTFIGAAPLADDITILTMESKV